MWRCNPATLHPELDELEDQEITESAPSCLRGTTHVLDLVTLGPDQCSMTYKGQGNHSPDVAAVQVSWQLRWTCRPCRVDHAARCCVPLHHASAVA